MQMKIILALIVCAEAHFLPIRNSDYHFAETFSSFSEQYDLPEGKNEEILNKVPPPSPFTPSNTSPLATTTKAPSLLAYTTTTTSPLATTKTTTTNQPDTPNHPRAPLLKGSWTSAWDEPDEVIYEVEDVFDANGKKIGETTWSYSDRSTGGSQGTEKIEETTNEPEEYSIQNELKQMRKGMKNWAAILKTIKKEENREKPRTNTQESFWSQVYGFIYPQSDKLAQQGKKNTESKDMRVAWRYSDISTGRPEGTAEKIEEPTSEPTRWTQESWKMLLKFLKGKGSKEEMDNGLDQQQERKKEMAEGRIMKTWSRPFGFKE